MRYKKLTSQELIEKLYEVTESQERSIELLEREYQSLSKREKTRRIHQRCFWQIWWI